VKQNIVKLYQDLDSHNADLVAHYKAVYVEFTRNPCDKAAADKLGKANSVIREKAYLIRAMQLELERENPDEYRLAELYKKLTEKSFDV
jgi:hypothetical protein